VVHQWNSTDADEDAHTWTVAGNASFMSIEYDNRTAWVNGSCDDQGWFNLWTNVSDGTAAASDAWVLYCDNVAVAISDKIVEEHWLAGTAYVHQWNSSDADEDAHTWTAEGNHSFGALQYSNRTSWFNGTCNWAQIGWFNVWTNVTDGTSSDNDAWILYCDNNAPTIDDKIVQENWVVNIATSHQWNSSDVDSQSHTWTLAGNASFASLEQDNRTAWVNGTCLVVGEWYNVWVNVTDGTDSDSDDFVLYCVVGNTAPTIDDKIVQENWNEDSATSHQWNATDPDADSWTWTVQSDPSAAFLGIEYNDLTAWVNGSCRPEGSYTVWTNISDGSASDSDQWTLTCNNQLPTISDKIAEEHWDEDSNVVHQWNSTDSDLDPHTWTVQGNASFMSIEYDNRTSWVNGSCEEEGWFNLWTNVSDGTDSDSDAWVLYCDNIAPTIADKIVEEYWVESVAMSHQWNSTDADEDAHTWSMGEDAGYLTLQQDNRSAWINGTCNDAPSSHPVYLNVTDGTDSDQEIWTLHCALSNSAPSITNPLIEDYAVEGEKYGYEFSATDVDNDALTWTILTDATFLNIFSNDATGTVYGTPDLDQDEGVYWVLVTVSDGSLTDTCNYTLRVSRATNPQSPITVYTHSEYDSGTNQLKVELWWTQSGGPEPAVVIKKYLIISVDGSQINGFIEASNVTYVDMPWNHLDSEEHNITVFGYLEVNWSSGPAVYRSNAEHLTASNFSKSLLIWFTIVIVFGIVVASVFHKVRRRTDRETKA
jgi:hypothetical protein